VFSGRHSAKKIRRTENKKPEINPFPANLNDLINYDTAKPYDSPDASKNDMTKKVADLGSSPETYDQAITIVQQVG